MAFPTTPLLDAFNRADFNPVDGNWGSPIYPGQDGFQIISLATAGIGNSYYSSFTAADCEVWATVAIEPADAGEIRLFLRLVNPNSASLDGYFGVFRKHSAAVDEFLIFRIDNTSSVIIDSVTGEFTSGDSIGMGMIGSTISIYHKPAAGSWTELFAIVDSTYTSPGYLGMNISDTTCRMDNFSGGSPGVGPGDNPPIGFLGRGAGW